MLRDIIKINEDLCTGCGDCVQSCHEGALQIIDGKARLISDLMCDGLGACIGDCPEGAITIEKRHAEPYNELKVMELMIKKGKNTIIAHLKHLKDHNELDLLKDGINYLKTNTELSNDEKSEIIKTVHHSQANHTQNHGNNCPGAKSMSFKPTQQIEIGKQNDIPSQLTQWPVQMHLINPQASFFKNSDVVLAADCVAYAVGNFHTNWLKNKSLIIACPKLDSGLDSYIEKIKILVNQAQINTLTVMMMVVPCCRGLLQIVNQALQQTQRKIPVKAVVVDLQGKILTEEWI